MAQKKLAVESEEPSPSRGRADELIRLLQSTGYKATPSAANENVVFSAASGYKFALFSEEDTLQFRCSVDITGAEMSLIDLNKFNSTYRFAKVYFPDGSEEKELILEYDFIMDLLSQDKDKYFEIVMSLIEASVGSLRMLINEFINRSKLT